MVHLAGFDIVNQIHIRLNKAFPTRVSDSQLTNNITPKSIFLNLFSENDQSPQKSYYVPPFMIEPYALEC